MCNKRGPLESLRAKKHCQMCGASLNLEPAFDPSNKPKTLCKNCRIGSAESLHSKNANQRRLVSDAVTQLYLSLTMCEHGDQHSDHANCRASLKKQFGRILEAIGHSPAQE